MNSDELIEIDNIETDAIEEEKEISEDEEVELSDNKKREVKKEQITALVTAYYKKFIFLQKLDLNKFINDSLDEYLDTDLTIEEINEKFMEKIIELMKDEEKAKEKENNNEMESMLSEPVNENEKENSMEFEKPKVFVKTDNNIDNESGFIHYRQLIVPYAVLVIMVVLIEIFNFIS